MTETRVSVPEIMPVPNSKLEQLLAQYDGAKAAYDEADKRLNALKTEIKAEVVATKPGQTKIRILSPYLARTLEMVYRTQWKMDSKRLKAEDPKTWVEYAYQSGTWYLQAAR